MSTRMTIDDALRIVADEQSRPRLTGGVERPRVADIADVRLNDEDS